MTVPEMIRDDVAAIENLMERWDNIPELDKIPPISNREIEDIRWELHKHLMNVNDENILELGDLSLRELVDKATDILHEIVEKIQRTWDL